jgi:hypothetical protein
MRCQLIFNVCRFRSFSVLPVRTLTYVSTLTHVECEGIAQAVFSFQIDQFSLIGLDTSVTFCVHNILLSLLRPNTHIV